MQLWHFSDLDFMKTSLCNSLGSSSGLWLLSHNSDFSGQHIYSPLPSQTSLALSALVFLSSVVRILLMVEKVLRCAPHLNTNKSTTAPMYCNRAQNQENGLKKSVKRQKLWDYWLHLCASSILMSEQTEVEVFKLHYLGILILSVVSVLRGLRVINFTAFPKYTPSAIGRWNIT